MIKREVIQKAIREYVGKVGYRYGSRNPDSGQVDCGGFIYSLLKESGIHIKDSNCKGLVKQLLDSKEYIKLGINDLQEGDIACFKSSLNPDLGNMGVVIDKNTFVYATNNNGVTIEFLDSGYVKENFIFGIGRKEKCSHCKGYLSGEADVVIDEDECKVKVDLKCSDCGYEEKTIIPVNLKVEYNKKKKTLKDISVYDFVQELRKIDDKIIIDIDSKEELWEIEALADYLGLSNKKIYDNLTIKSISICKYKFTTPFVE